MRIAGAFAVAAVLTYLLTPAAIRIAIRTGFFDLPAGYKGHRAPTPYLGGTAIILGIIPAVVVVGGIPHRYTPLLICVVVMWVTGTIDDKVSLPIALRLLLEVGVGVAFTVTGLGWTVFHEGIADGVLSVIWVVGVMNAFNLMDNMDGASATTAAVSAAGAGTLALMGGRTALGCICFATAGACAGFLPRNLANPARIFMGDGGSLPLGLLVAGVTMSAVNRSYLGPSGVVIAALLAGLVIFDTTLVTISRTRAGRSVLRGGRDHTTHRLGQLLGSPRHVAMALACTQFALCSVTIVVAQAGSGWVLLAGGFAFLAGCVLIWQFERSPLLVPQEIAEGAEIEASRSGANEAGKTVNATPATLAAS